MSVAKVKRRTVLKPNKPLLRQLGGYVKNFPVGTSVSENNLAYNFRSQQRKRKAFTRSSSPSPVIYFGTVPQTAMSSIIDLTKSDSDILIQPRKKPKRDSTMNNQRINQKQQAQKRNIYKCHSLITIKPSDRLATASSEELLHTNTYMFNTSINCYYNMPAKKETAKVYAQAIQTTDSAIQLKRSYPFTSVTNIGSPRPEVHPTIDDTGFGDMQLDTAEELEIVNMHQHIRNAATILQRCDCLGCDGSQPDEAEEEANELLLVDDVVKQIHNDASTFQMDDNEMSVYDMDIDSMLNIYDVNPHDHFGS